MRFGLAPKAMTLDDLATMPLKVIDIVTTCYNCYRK